MLLYVSAKYSDTRFGVMTGWIGLELGMAVSLGQCYVMFNKSWHPTTGVDMDKTCVKGCYTQ